MTERESRACMRIFSTRAISGDGDGDGDGGGDGDDGGPRIGITSAIIT